MVGVGLVTVNVASAKSPLPVPVTVIVYVPADTPVATAKFEAVNVPEPLTVHAGTGSAATGVPVIVQGAQIVTWYEVATSYSDCTSCETGIGCESNFWSVNYECGLSEISRAVPVTVIT